MSWKTFCHKHKKKIIGIPIIVFLIPLIFNVSNEQHGIQGYLTGAFWSAVHAILIWTGADYINAYGVKKYPLFDETKKRILVMALGVTILVTLVVGLIAGMYFMLDASLCTLEKIIEDYKISFIVTTIVVLWEEAIYLMSKWKESIIETERLQKQTVVAHYETLKNQVNPHFLFNSLNTLTALIHQDPVKAEQFTEEFAKVYRYLLEMKDQSVIMLSEEIEFVKSYIFLQKKRYGDSLKVDLNLSAKSLEQFIAPVSLQLIVENAIKHNTISSAKPLYITIEDHDMYLKVVNNLQKRDDYKVNSTGLGLKNLKDKYAIISGLSPEFYIEGDYYVARIPMITPDI